MTCRFGGFVIIESHVVRNLEAKMFSSVCKDVELKPPFLPLNSGDYLTESASETGRIFWRPLQKFYSDVDAPHLNCHNSLHKALKTIFKQNETSKKNYIGHVHEKQCSTTTNHFHKVLAEKLSQRAKTTYANAITFIRKRLSFIIIRMALIDAQEQNAKTRGKQRPSWNLI